MAAFSARGTYTALVTPFVADGSQVDWDAYDRLLTGQLEGGVSGVVPCGTTGESPTLTDPEQLELVRRAVVACRGRATVVAGTGSNDTKKTIAASRAAFEAGADAVMVVMPYYNKPSQRGLFEHVAAVARAVEGPIVLYNVPGRTVVGLEPDTLRRVLDACPNVVGLKDASNHVLYCQRLADLGERLSVLCGDDALTVPMMSVGARGVISVTSNLYPAAVAGVVTAMLQGRWAEARDRHLALLPVHEVLFVEPNPAPVKAALASKGLMQATLRLPMVAAEAPTTARLAQVLAAYEAR